MRFTQILKIFLHTMSLTDEQQFELLYQQKYGSVSSDLRMNTQPCGWCGSFLRVEHKSDGDIVCKDCGNICDSFVDCGAEWISGVDDNGTVSDSSRGDTLTNDLYDNSQLGTNIYSHGRKQFFHQLQVQTLMHQKDRSIYNASKKMDTHNQETGISAGIMNRAKHIFKDFNKNVLTRGRIRQGAMAACVFLACKEANIHKSIKDISDAYKIQQKDFNQGLKEVLNWQSTQKRCIDVTESNNYEPIIMSIVNKVCGDNRDLRILIMGPSLTLGEKVIKSGEFEGKTPIGIVAGIISYVCITKKIQFNKQFISEQTNVSQPTINKIIKMLSDLKLSID